VEKMRSDGPFIALHLRYEKDMLAFSGCTYGLTEAEANELSNIRLHTAHWKVKDINSTDQRSRGFCPLTPTEIGIFLRALGYPKGTRIYIAAGEIYGGDERIAGLLSRFPNVMRKVGNYAHGTLENSIDASCFHCVEQQGIVLIVCKVLSRDIGTTLWTTMVINI
jgi:hypothetical protein